MARAKQNSKIEFLTESVVKGITGNKQIEAIKLENLKSGKNYLLPADAILIRIGIQPNTDFLRGKLELDEKGYIKIDRLGKTSVEGIRAIGDVAIRFHRPSAGRSEWARLPLKIYIFG